MLLAPVCKMRSWTPNIVSDDLHCDWNFVQCTILYRFHQKLFYRVTKCGVYAVMCSLKAVVECVWRRFPCSFWHCSFYSTLMHVFGFSVDHLWHYFAQLGVVEEIGDGFWQCQCGILSLIRFALRLSSLGASARSEASMSFCRFWFVSSGFWYTVRKEGIVLLCKMSSESLAMGVIYGSSVDDLVVRGSWTTTIFALRNIVVWNT